MRKKIDPIKLSRVVFGSSVVILFFYLQLQVSEASRGGQTTPPKSLTLSQNHRGSGSHPSDVAQEDVTQIVPPANDDFGNAITVNFQIAQAATNVAATKEAGEPNHAGNVGGKSVWYVLPGSTFGGRISLRNSNTNFDTLLAVYKGPSVGSLSSVASNDNYGSGLRSEVYVPFVSGTTYRIAVDGFNGTSGDFTISEDYNRLYLATSRFRNTGTNPVTVFRPSNGTWYTTSTNGFQFFQWGQSGDIPVPADYDGDGLTDYAVFRPSNGTWYVLESGTGQLHQVPFGQSGDKPVQGDYNADGLIDYAIFRPSNGTWYILDHATSTFSYTQFGQNGDKPVQDYYDGDGKMDIAVFRPSNSTWYIQNSFTNSVTTLQWGASGDIPVPGDYGVNVQDGKADIAVWRPSNGTWYELTSNNNQLVAKQFGQNGDIPQPSDQVGVGGKFAYCVFRPSNGTWYIETPSGQFQAIPFGTNGDKPAATFFDIQP